MTFLNEALLAGLATMAIPVMIHVIHRSRYRVVRWGATHLLQDTMSRRSRWIRLEQLLLLLLRMAILGVLAFLMARPAITGLSGYLGLQRGRTSAALVLDVSYSMGHGATFAEAREAALAVLKLLGNEDTATLVLAGERPTVIFPVPTRDLNSVEEAIRQAEPVFGRASVDEAVGAALDSLERSPAARREMYVVSDLQSGTWSREVLLRVTDRLRNSRKTGVTLSWTLISVGDGGGDNVSVDALEVPAVPFVPSGKSVATRVRVTNRGTAPRTALDVSLLVDGQGEGGSRISIDPGGSREVLFQPTLSEPGSHRLEARVESDRLPGDDRFFAVVNVREHLSVLVLDGDPRPDPLRSETDFLRLALAPFPRSSGVRGGFFDVEIRRRARAPEDAKNEVLEDLPDFPVAVLANVATFSEIEAARLDTFVREGGGLLIFAGDKLDVESYNRLFFREGQGLLPGKLLPHPGLPPPLAGDAVGIRLEEPRHPALEGLFLSAGELETAKIREWLRLDLDRNLRKTQEAGGVRVLANLESDGPLLVEKRHGDGRVIFCATACDDDWSNLVLRPYYLPLVQQLVTYLAGSKAVQSNLATGGTISVFFPREREGAEIAIRLPDGREQRGLAFPRGSRAAFEYRDTYRPGFYTVSVNGEPPLDFAVNPDRDESDLTWTERELIEEAASGTGLEIVEGKHGVLASERFRRHGLEIWKPLVGLVLLLSFLELFLVQRFERGATS